MVHCLPVFNFMFIQVVVKVTNNLGTEGITVHWHGIHQIGTPWNDGVPVISQCVTDPGESYKYKYVY